MGRAMQGENARFEAFLVWPATIRSGGEAGFACGLHYMHRQTDESGFRVRCSWQAVLLWSPQVTLARLTAKRSSCV